MARSSGLRKKVWLVQRGVWAMDVESMPLASGYFKAMVDVDPVLSSEFDVRIFNFGGGHSTLEMAKQLFLGEDGAPDLLAFSVFGWNFNAFGKLSELFRQVNPGGVVVFGGTHVANQAKRTFAMYPDVDVIVDGEGELTFVDLLRNLAAGRHQLDQVHGITFKRPDGVIVKTPDRPRIENLDLIPSPLLTGTISLRDPQGRLRYDVVLLETNRGCPYSCSFCYWGGAIGQKVRVFSPDRIAEELDLVGREKVAEVVLCDANFGMLEEDQTFIEVFLKMREKYGYPRGIETSWTKNKSKRFYSIVERMKKEGLRSSFTLALQTLHDPSLILMKRKNMKVNDWRDLSTWLKGRGLDCYAELIWGTPGETAESFLDGYAQLSEHVSRIAVYPLLIMPNTDYSERRDAHGFVLLRGENDDFEYVLSNKTMSFEDNKRIHKFIFWARVVAEHQVLRYIWAPFLRLAGIGQVEILLSLDEWFAKQTDSTCKGLLACRADMVENLDASRVLRGLQYFYLEENLPARLMAWFHEEMLPRLKPEHAQFLEETFQYDLVTRPLFRSTARRVRSRGDLDLETVQLYGETYFVRPDFVFHYDIPAMVAKLRAGEDVELVPQPRTVALHFREGFANHIANHEFVARYVGLTRDQIDAEMREASVRPGDPIPIADETARNVGQRPPV